MKQRNEEADADEHTLRLSMDAKATLKVGPFARGGKSRVVTKAADQDFEAAATVTPVGIFLPASDELFLYGVMSKVTSDCLVDRLVDWWESESVRFPDITTLVLNLDNGPESHSRRTQFMHRLVEFAQRYCLKIRLAYYPPYHSKYNPIERGFGILEQHWNGALLDSLEAVIQYASTMTWKGKHPVVSTSDHRISDWGQTHQGSDAGSRNPAVRDYHTWTSGSWTLGFPPQLSRIANNSFVPKRQKTIL